MTLEVDRAERAALRARWRADGWYPGFAIGEALRRGAAARPHDRLVFAQVGGRTDTVQLGQLYARAQRMAGKLFTAGIRSNDTVMVQAAADGASTEVLIALWTLGAVVVPVTATATSDDVAHIVRETRAVGAVVAPSWRGVDLVSDLAANRSRLGLEAIVVLGEGPSGTIPLAALDGAHLPELPASDPSAVACVIYTSGSTAAAKGVRHSHETLLSGLTAMPADAQSCMLGTFPAGHVAALMALLRPLTSGGTTVLMDRWSARAAVELIEEHQVTVGAGTPFFLSTLLDEAHRSGRDITSLERFLCGAATVPSALVERALAAGIVSWRTYGSTEHPAISAGSPLDPPEKRRLTDGRVAPGNEVRLVDEAGTDVGPGAEGEIVARGPKQFLGYQDPATDEAAFLDSTWFRTGDLARFDEDGYLVVTDRVKDIIIRGGENISAREVEEVIAQHPDVREVTVLAAPDEVWGEAVCAVVVARSGADGPSLTELASHAAAAGLAPHKAPARVVLVDQLPRTTAGKVRKRDLRPLLWPRHDPPSH